MRSIRLSFLKPSVLLERFNNERLLRDKLSMSILIPSLLINLATVIILVVRVQPTNIALPVHYSSLEGFDKLGQWYQLYYIGVFGLSVTLVNAVLAALAFSRSRITSFFLLAGAFVVALFSFVISAAFVRVV